MTAKRRFLLTLLFALAISETRPQNAVCQILYGQWSSDSSHNFGSVDPQTGQRVTIASIPRSSSFSVVATSNTLDPVNKSIYFCAIESGNWLYSVGMETGSVNRTSTGGDGLSWLNYDFDSQMLYGRWMSDDFYNFGSVDPQTGEKLMIAGIPRSSSFSLSALSNTLDPVNNIIYFGAIESGNWLYSIGMEAGNVTRISTGGDRLDWLDYDFDSQTLYGRWSSDSSLNFGSIDPQTGQRVTIASIPRSLSFSLSALSNTLDPVNNIIYFGAIESGNWLYSIAMETGSITRISTGGDRLDWLDSTPEPSTLILLSIGGLALLRKPRTL